MIVRNSEGLPKNSWSAERITIDNSSFDITLNKINSHTICIDNAARKTITISEEACDTLAAKKAGNESFTDVILRITTNRGKASSLLKYVESLPPDEALANSIKSSMKRTRRAKLRRVDWQNETGNILEEKVRKKRINRQLEEAMKNEGCMKVTLNVAELIR